LAALVLAVSIGTWLGRDDGPTAEAASAEAKPDGTDVVVGPPPPPLTPPPAEETVAGIPFSIGAPIGGWERFAFSINRSVTGPQGAEAIIFWAGLPDDGGEVSPCDDVVGGWLRRSAADLATAVAAAPGTELVRGPLDVTVGGFPAKHVSLTVRERQGCDPGFFFTWPHDQCYGACWLQMGVGATIRVWIVDVEAGRIVIEAATTRQATPQLEREVVRIVRSVRFGE
jgi:hypothetical protein